MRILSGLVAGTAMMVAGSATAQSSDASANGFYINGYAELSYFESGGFDDTFARANLDMGFPPTAGISSWPIGFSLGIDAVNFNNNSEYALYPAVTFALGNGLISAGIPRSVYDKGYIPDRKFGGSGIIDFSLIEFSGSFLAAAYLLESGIDPYGVRYDGEFGNTKFGASYHHVNTGNNSADVYALAFQHELEAISSLYDLLFFGGLEYIDTGGSSVSGYELGVEAGTDKLRAGVSLGSSDLGGPDVDWAKTFANYQISDVFLLNGTYASLNAGGSSAEIYSLGLEYKFLNNGYVRANYADGDIFSSDPFYEVTVGWRF